MSALKEKKETKKPLISEEKVSLYAGAPFFKKKMKKARKTLNESPIPENFLPK